MLIKVTNRCSAGCFHCMEDSTRAGTHMSRETFLAALECSARLEAGVTALGLPRMLLLSGGECSEHPDFVRLVEIAAASAPLVFLLTNGQWLARRELRDAILRPEWGHVCVQVTHDARYYPSAPPPRIDDPRVRYTEKLGTLIGLGRAARRPLPGRLMIAPGSFNLRSLTHATGDIVAAITLLRMRRMDIGPARSAAGLPSGNCTPSIADDGRIMAGETRSCHVIGTVDSSPAELTRGILEMKSCNRCGLETGLGPEHRAAIGLGATP